MRFSEADASNKNRPEERTINMVVNMTSTMLMHDALICPKDTFPLILANGNELYCTNIQSYT